MVVRDYETESIYSSVAKLYRYNLVTNQVFDLCTGWWIGNNLMATAAHCVFDTKLNSWYIGGNWTIMAVFGLNGPFSPFSCGGMTCPDSYARQGYVDTQYSIHLTTQARIFTDYATLPAFSATAGVDVALITLDGTPQTTRYCWAEPHFCPGPSANLASSTSRRPITNRDDIYPKDGYYTYEGDKHDHNIINVHCDCPACPPCPSYPDSRRTCVHKNMGYPAETLPGWDLVFDMSTNEAADVDPRSPDLLRELVNIEGGNSGGPLFASYKDPTVLGIASAIVSGCPAYYKSPAVGVPISQNPSLLTTLDELVKQEGGRVYTSGGHHCVIS